MAIVYRGYHPGLDRYVALKVLYPHFAQDQTFLQRFHREARAVARLRHPNIVQVHDFGVEGDTYYMAMEFIQGPTLKARLAELGERGEHLPLDEMARILREVGKALDYAHGRGILHRDIKPANIMFTEENEVVLTDFGIARLTETAQMTRTGASVGTPEYMSPEQGEGRPVDSRSDLYSLGIVLYEMLTGQVPFSADTPLAVVLKHIRDPLVLPRTLQPQLPEAVDRVVMKVLAKAPQDRFQTGEEFANAVAAATTGIAAPAVSVPVAPPAPAPLERATIPIISEGERPAPLLRRLRQLGPVPYVVKEGIAIAFFVLLILVAMRSLPPGWPDEAKQIIGPLFGPEGPLTKALRPLTKVLPPGEVDVGRFGMMVVVRDDRLLISNVGPEGHSARLGLGVGDAILAIEGEKVQELGPEQAAQTLARYPKERLHLTILPKAGTRPVEVWFSDSAPWMSVGAYDERIKVLHVTPGEPSDMLGLRAGDTIVALDGTDPAKLGAEKALERLKRWSPGLRLSVLSQGEAQPREVAFFQAPVEMLVGLREKRLSVLHIHDGGAAHILGLKVGDEIVAIDGVELPKLGIDKTIERLSKSPFMMLRLTVLHKGETTPEEVWFSGTSLWMNVGARDSRLVVLPIGPGEPPELLGLVAGDVITAIDGVPIPTLGVEKALTQLMRRRPKMRLGVQHAGETQPVEVWFVQTPIEMEVGTRDNRLLVIEAYPEHAADILGCKRGDTIVTIDGVEVSKLGLEKALERLTKPFETRLSLGILHKGETQPTEIQFIQTPADMMVGRSDSRLTVVQVGPGGRADKAGLNPGDRIVNIDGAELEKIGVDAGIARLLAPLKGLRTIGYEREGTPGRAEAKLMP
ncbi:MAG: PDZ domain-containing protein [Chloroflexi bacterium]|nr:PDZ domain-containing protein [Chloroflexota bacterium]